MMRFDDNPPQCWPEDVFAEGRQLAGPWHVAYVKPRQEKALAWELQKKQIPYFLPMLLRETTGGGRRRQTLLPMFASYLFFAADENQRLAALKTERIVRLIDASPEARQRLAQELAAIEVAIRTSPQSIELHPRLVPGARAIIRSGPLRGFEGVVLPGGNRHRLWLGVTALGSGITVEIHPDLVDPE